MLAAVDKDLVKAAGSQLTAKRPGTRKVETPLLGGLPPSLFPGLRIGGKCHHEKYRHYMPNCVKD